MLGEFVDIYKNAFYLIQNRTTLSERLHIGVCYIHMTTIHIQINMRHKEVVE